MLIGSTIVQLACGTLIFVDDCDLELVRSREWRRHRGTGRNAGRSYITTGRFNDSLHRVIMGAQPGQVVDHRNGNTLDFRRGNLRLTDDVGNARNQAKKRASCYGASTSGFKGVSLDRRHQSKPWKAQIRDNQGRMRNLGNHPTEHQAAYAYDVASLQFHGEMGRRNFLPLVQKVEASMV